MHVSDVVQIGHIIKLTSGAQMLCGVSGVLNLCRDFDDIVLKLFCATKSQVRLITILFVNRSQNTLVINAIRSIGRRLNFTETHEKELATLQGQAASAAVRHLYFRYASFSPVKCVPGHISS